jgi:hypothetical protein
VSRRLKQRLFRLADEIVRIGEEERLTAEELRIHEHLDDDARRDALVADTPLARLDARETSGDVARLRRALESLRMRRSRLEAKRERLLQRLD